MTSSRSTGPRDSDDSRAPPSMSQGRRAVSACPTMRNRFRSGSACSVSPTSPGARAGDRLTRALSEDQAWQLLFLDYVERAAHDAEGRAQFAVHRRQVRQLAAAVATNHTTPPSLSFSRCAVRGAFILGVRLP